LHVVTNDAEIAKFGAVRVNVLASMPICALKLEREGEN